MPASDGPSVSRQNTSGNRTVREWSPRLPGKSSCKLLHDNVDFYATGQIVVSVWQNNPAMMPECFRNGRGVSKVPSVWRQN
jgi:hypothetical protein